jgi:hypothetical protein
MGPVWIGVDVGGKRKGFDVAVIDGRRVLALQSHLWGVPARTNQDQRDAVAAAMTARQHSLALTETIGDIVVPAGRW